MKHMFLKKAKFQSLGIIRIQRVVKSIVNSLKQQSVNIKEGEGDDEFQITRLENTSRPLNIVNCYGEQDTRSSRTEILNRWFRLKCELQKIIDKDEYCMLVGDLNKLIGNDNLGIEGNNAQISFGGQLVRELVASGDWILLNNSERAVGGPWTREDPSNTNIKSCLDLVLLSKNLDPYVKKLLIDSKRKISIKRPIFKKGKWCLTHSDHYTLVITIVGLPKAKMEKE